MSTAKRRTGDAIALHTNVAALAVPTGSPSAFNEKIRAPDGTAPREVEISIIALAAGPAVLTGPVLLWGNEDPAASVDGVTTDQWQKIATLNAGANISVTNKAGYTERVLYAGSYRMLALSAALAGANVTVKLIPITDFTG